MEDLLSSRAVFTREMIVDAAFSITREKGWKAVTARTISKRLECSTMPIYSLFQSMEPIGTEVKTRAGSLMQEYQKRPYTEDPMLNIAIGYVIFARDELNLFRFLFIDNPTRLSDKATVLQAEEFTKEFGSVKGVREAMDQIPESMSNPLMLKSWIFTHGLASMIGEGVLTLTDETIRSLLLSAGGAFYIWDQAQANETGKGEAE